MAQILFVYLLTLAQWDVSGKAGEVPLPLPLGPNMPETDWPRFEFTLFGSSPTGFTSRAVIWESETDDFCIHSVRTSTAKNAMKIGKLFSYCLGTAWSCECLLPTTYWLPEFSACLRWYPMENVSLAAGIRSGFPSITLCISP